MLQKEDIIHYLEIQKEEFAEQYQVTRLGLFGSFAQDIATEKSDIDLIVDFAPKTESLYEKKQIIREKMEKKFKRKVDLCQTKYIKPYFKNEILKSAIYV